MIPSIPNGLSGIQLYAILGVVLLLSGVFVGIGHILIALSIVGWLVYNLLSIGQQF
ncbi:hypothetical protein [Salinibaculum salinum]|uniref:hypothetical protein n=1 Tax=Salinibaculum salinum TaxID=3131996 RepID=UPI0030ECFEF1